MNANTALMGQTAKEIDGSADTLTRTLSSLMNELVPLQDAFKGAGGSSFQQVKMRFEEDMGKLNAALRAIAEAVGSAGTDYTVTDQEIQHDMEQAGASAGSITQALKLN
jgi:WXG100 family type VII secretion target